jgi:hypothetical protein
MTALTVDECKVRLSALSDTALQSNPKGSSHSTTNQQCIQVEIAGDGFTLTIGSRGLDEQLMKGIWKLQGSLIALPNGTRVNLRLRPRQYTNDYSRFAGLLSAVGSILWLTEKGIGSTDVGVLEQAFGLAPLLICALPMWALVWFATAYLEFRQNELGILMEQVFLSNGQA